MPKLLARSCNWLLYDASLAAYRLGVWLAARVGHAKARARLQAAAETRRRLRQAPKPSDLAGPRIWMHAASWGEYEMARPLLRAWRQEQPEALFILSLFSPSGLQRARACQQQDGVTAVWALDWDTPRAASRWLAQLQPDLALFIRYDHWRRHLQACQLAGVPTVLAAQHTPQQVLRGFTALRLRQDYRQYNLILPQTSHNLAQLAALAPHAQLTPCGNPRFDQVAHAAHSLAPQPQLEQFLRGRRVLVAGSTWPADEALLEQLWAQAPEEAVLIIAPHEPNQQAVQRLLDRFPQALRWAQWRQGTPQPAQRQVLLADTLGELFGLYQLADVAYVGGGFGAGIHSILEPLALGAPVLFGPRHHRFPEAGDALGLNPSPAACVEHAAAAVNVLQAWGWWSGEAQLLDTRRQAAGSFVLQRAQAAPCIVQQARALFV